ncbi:MFS transporter [Streptomyces sp. NPDC050636]|uniref:MFS transporter n=1 Tax=Streptomyces sp. NPDC050636 TaxID=3154510 RepID=UPI00341E2103
MTAPTRFPGIEGSCDMEAVDLKDRSTPSSVLPRGPGVVWFGISGFVNSTGTGFFHPFALLFFTELSGESLRSVGLVLTVTALAVLPGLFAVGRLVDRLGPRFVLTAAAALRAVAFAGFISLRGLVPLVVCGLLLALGDRAELAARPLMAIRLAPEGQRSQWLALTRVVFNAGIGAGALFASLFVVDTGSGFVILGAINAASFVLAALLYLGIPASKTTEAAFIRPISSPRAAPWRHVAYLRVAGANSLLLTAAFAMETALPVFILRELAMPPWIVGALFAVNTVLLALLQLPMSRVLDRFRPPLVLALGGMSYVALYVAALLAGGVPQGAQIALMVGGMALYTLGELAVSQASLVMLTSLPPHGEQGAYLAFNQLFAGGAAAIAPLLVTAFLADWPAGLWWALAGVSVVAAILSLSRREEPRVSKEGRSHEPLGSA